MYVRESYHRSIHSGKEHLPSHQQITHLLANRSLIFHLPLGYEEMTLVDLWQHRMSLIIAAASATRVCCNQVDPGVAHFAFLIRQHDARGPRGDPLPTSPLRPPGSPRPRCPGTIMEPPGDVPYIHPPRLSPWHPKARAFARPLPPLLPPSCPEAVDARMRLNSPRKAAQRCSTSRT